MPCAAFGRPYSRHRFCFLFLRVLRCFNSPRSPSRLGVRQEPQEVPFGNPRFDGCLRLAGAYRSLPRPSSAPRAEPSTRRLRFSAPYSGGWAFFGSIGLCTVLIVTPVRGLGPFHPKLRLGCAPLRGGPAGIRTRGLRLAKPTLSQAELPAHGWQARHPLDPPDGFSGDRR